MTLYETSVESPLGRLRLLADDRGLRGVYYPQHKNPSSLEGRLQEDHPVLREARKQLEEYFRGQRLEFDLPLALEGTPFMLIVWKALSSIPFGERLSYGGLAEKIGRPLASRAVGRANGLNPVSIIVPCHRVVGKSGQLTGYAGGLRHKQWLLEHEQSVSTFRSLP